MRGQVLWVALLSAAPGDPVLPTAQPVVALAVPGLAPSPYLPELAPDPFTTPEMALRAEPLPLRRARPRPAPPHVALLAPSPYDRDLMSDPYAGSSTSGAGSSTSGPELAV